MAGPPVAYSDSIACSNCGLEFHGYLEVEPQGLGKVLCPRCGAKIEQRLPPDYVPQIPPADFESAEHPHVHHTHYPDLYGRPKQHPRLDLADLVRILYSPTSAFKRLYLATDMHRAIAIVIVFSMLSVAVSVLVTIDMADLVGYDTRDAIYLGASSVIALLLSIFTFLIFAMTASALAKGMFGGRGERAATITLLGYCFPLYVLVNIMVLAVFRIGLGVIEAGPIWEWTSSELNRASAGVILLVVVALIGVVWLLVISSKAISVANDISVGEGLLTAVMSATAAGVVYLVVDAMIALPLGLSF